VAPRGSGFPVASAAAPWLFGAIQVRVQGARVMAEEVQEGKVFTTVAAVLMVSLVAFGVLSLLGVFR